MENEVVHIFALALNETVKIGEAAYRYIGDGLVEGVTAPDQARGLRDDPNDDKAGDAPDFR